MKILYKFATRERPHKFFAAIENIITHARHPHYLIVVSADIDDPLMFNRDIIKGIEESYDKVVIYYGTSKSKVDAINRDLAYHTDWDILINMSDDMEFIKYGFDLEIIKDFQSFRTLDLLLHYPDQKAWFAMCTMAIMGREYYLRDGYIYNPIYKSLFCDNEQMEVAKMRGKYKYIKKRLFNHNNPMWGLSDKDALHLKTLADHKEDKATFERREKEMFV